MLWNRTTFLIEHGKGDAGRKLGRHDADAASDMRIPRVRIEGGDAFALLDIVAHGEALLKAAQHIVVIDPGGSVVEQVAGPGDIPASHQHRIQAEVVGEPFHEVLHHQGPLRPPEASEGRVGGQIGPPTQSTGEHFFKGGDNKKFLLLSLR